MQKRWTKRSNEVCNTIHQKVNRKKVGIIE